MSLTVLTYNTLFAGKDGTNGHRADAQVNLIKDIKPDVFLMQEAKGFETNGQTALHALEHAIGMRGFLAPAPRTGQNICIFIRAPLRPISFDADGTNFHHVAATLKVASTDHTPPLTFIGVHLCPNGASVRRREAAYLAVQASSDSYSLLAGDFNSASPYDSEPANFDELPQHHRARYIADDLAAADRSVLSHLGMAGWSDIGHALGGSTVPTVPTAQFHGSEFPIMRCDYLLATAPLARLARSYQVIRTPETDMASDHYPILASFEFQ